VRIGIPREVQPGEGRVALVPGACASLVRAGHSACIEAGAGLAAGYPDDAYRAAGAQVVPDAAGAWAAELVVKVKDPVPAEWGYLRPGLTLFSFLHLAANAPLGKALADAGATALAFETVSEGGRLTILEPMSMVAGRVAVLQAAALLCRPGGSGVLLGGVAGAPRGRVVVVGAGSVGTSAAASAAALGAEVIAFDRKPDRLAAVRALGPNVTGLYADPELLAREIAAADLVIGAVLLPGHAAPRVITRAMVQAMRPGSVLADVAVDQGGCAETTRPTGHTDPTYLEAGVIHYAVTNIPGGAPRTATPPLSAVLAPYVQSLAGADWRSDPVLARAIAVDRGRPLAAA
jgi:alanine dehydrogenase